MTHGEDRTCRHSYLAVSLHLHVSHCRAPHPLHVAGTLLLHAPCHYAPCGCVHCIALPLAAARIVLLCLLWLHTLCHSAPHSCTHHIALPLMTACTVSPCLLWLSWLHTLHHCASCTSLLSACMLFFFLFLLTSSFALSHCAPMAQLLHSKQDAR